MEDRYIIGTLNCLSGGDEIDVYMRYKKGILKVPCKVIETHELRNEVEVIARVKERVLGVDDIALYATNMEEAFDEDGWLNHFAQAYAVVEEPDGEHNSCEITAVWILNED